MATTDRQNRLLVAEDWRKIYQAFQQADFKSYDFETLRRTMVAYLKENYPDDFNDFVESSEYVALIDLIAYISQALSFRVDLNARENFLETAERRNSCSKIGEANQLQCQEKSTGNRNVEDRFYINNTGCARQHRNQPSKFKHYLERFGKFKLQRTIHCDTERGQPDRTTIWQSKRIGKDRRNRHRGVHIKFQPVRSSHIQISKNQWEGYREDLR